MNVLTLHSIVCVVARLCARSDPGSQHRSEGRAGRDGAQKGSDPPIARRVQRARTKQLQQFKKTVPSPRAGHDKEGGRAKITSCAFHHGCTQQNKALLLDAHVQHTGLGEQGAGGPRGRPGLELDLNSGARPAAGGWSRPRQRLQQRHGPRGLEAVGGDVAPVSTCRFGDSGSQAPVSSRRGPQAALKVLSPPR